MIQGKNILVTGGSGFVGNWLCHALQEDNFVTSCSRNLRQREGITSISCDLTKKEDVRKLPDFDVCFHLAGNTDISLSQHNKDFDYHANVTATLNLLEEIRARNIASTLIFSSTGNVYAPSDTKLKETSALGPLSNYAMHKLLAENSIIRYVRNYGLDAKIARLFFPYGPEQPVQRVVSKFIDNIIHGNQVQVQGDGAQTYDFTYITDTIAGLLHMIKSKPGEIYNIALGEGYSINDLILKLSTLLGRKAYLTYSQEKLDYTYFVADIEKVKKDLGFNPSISLDAGLKHMLASRA